MGLGGLLGQGNHKSIIGTLGGKLQKWTDPIAMIPGVGDKWVDLTSNKIPELTNKTLSKVMTPFDRIDETINPVRKIPIVDRIGDVVRDKPGDAIGIALGGYFAAPAIAGAAGGAAGSAGAGGGAGALGGAGASGITAGSSFIPGGTALGSTAGMTGGWGSVMGGAGPVASVSPMFNSGSTMTQDLSGMRPQGNWMDLAQRALGQQQQQAQQRGQQQSQGGGLERLIAENEMKRQAQAMALAQFNQQQQQAALQNSQRRQGLAAQLRR